MYSYLTCSDKKDFTLIFDCDRYLQKAFVPIRCRSPDFKHQFTTSRSN